MRLFALIACTTAVGVTLGLCACHPQPLPPEPVHVVTIGDASFTGTTCEVSHDVLAALGCSEALASRDIFVSKCEELGDDFDFSCVAASHTTDAVRKCGVKCPLP